MEISTLVFLFLEIQIEIERDFFLNTSFKKFFRKVLYSIQEKVFIKSYLTLNVVPTFAPNKSYYLCLFLHF